MTILGTRPEIIRLSRTIARLKDYVDHVLVHTGQNWDATLNEIFFSDLGLPQPDHYLGVDTSSLGATVGGILIEVERVLREELPDAVLILGDTNSAIAAYIARRMKIPVYHMEAGNRCFDRNVPEETNRRLVDHLADFNLCYTEHARRNLLAEGLAPRRIYVTGSPMREVLDYYRNSIEASTILDKLGLEHRRYILASLHREENVDNAASLHRLVRALEQLGQQHGCPVIISTHPRTRTRLDALQAEVGGVVEHTQAASDLRWLEPFGFHDYNRLQQSALCVLSDSGTLAEESSMLGFPGVTPRFSIERPEALDTGAVIACGTDPEDILRAVHATIKQAEQDSPLPASPSGSFVPGDYCIDNTSQRVVNLILGTAKLSNAWDGIRMNSGSISRDSN